jgi:hypothetical protein
MGRCPNGVISWLHLLENQHPDTQTYQKEKDWWCSVLLRQRYGVSHHFLFLPFLVLTLSRFLLFLVRLNDHKMLPRTLGCVE